MGKKLGDTLIEALHARSLPGFNDVWYLANPVLADAVSHGGVADHHLDGGYHTRLVDAPEEGLGDDGLVVRVLAGQRAVPVLLRVQVATTRYSFGQDMRTLA